MSYLPELRGTRAHHGAVHLTPTQKCEQRNSTPPTGPYVGHYVWYVPGLESYLVAVVGAHNVSSPQHREALMEQKDTQESQKAGGGTSLQAEA